MLVASLRGRFWFSLKDFMTESQYFFARKEVPNKRKTPSYRRCWSIVSFSAVKNLRHAHICLLKAVYLHPSKPLISLVFITCTTYCFPSQSQTLFGLGAGRPPLGQYCSYKHPRDFYRSSPLVISVSRTF